MNYTYESYTKVRPLASHIKHILKAYGGRIPPLADGRVFTEKDLTQYVGGLFDIEANRVLLIKLDGVAGTFRSVLTKQEYNLFIQILKKYKAELYGNLAEIA